MNLYPELVRDKPDFTRWRKDIHANPELAFEEVRTAAFVAEKLREVGIEVYTGIGKTGVVGTLRKGAGNASIGLRADLDALSMQEANSFDHRSNFDGKFHGCGHDGHTVMLLAAARYLAQHSDFNGTVHFIFQPAEEGQGGAHAMIEDGLFEKFPMQAIYGMHNAPGIPVGSFALCEGPMLASYESFDIKVLGTGGHGAMPHTCVDPIIIGSQIVQALQTVVSRSVDPLDPVVLSVTRFHAGDAYNVIPEGCVLGGTIRHFNPTTGQTIVTLMREITDRVARAHGGKAEITFRKPGYPALVNDPACTRIAATVATEISSPEQVDSEIRPLMGSDDFAYFSREKPGCYILIGNGADSVGGCMVHHPEYDFNDEIIPLGASFWTRLVERTLA